MVMTSTTAGAGMTRTGGSALTSKLAALLSKPTTTTTVKRRLRRAPTSVTKATREAAEVTKYGMSRLVQGPPALQRAVEIVRQREDEALYPELYQDMYYEEEPPKAGVGKWIVGGVVVVGVVGGLYWLWKRRQADEE